MEQMKATQRELVPTSRGKTKQVYMKPEIEGKAMEYCKEQNMSLSLLIRLALEEYLEKRGAVNG